MGLTALPALNSRSGTSDVKRLKGLDQPMKLIRLVVEVGRNTQQPVRPGGPSGNGYLDVMVTQQLVSQRLAPVGRGMGAVIR